MFKIAGKWDFFDRLWEEHPKDGRFIIGGLYKSIEGSYFIITEFVGDKIGICFLNYKDGMLLRSGVSALRHYSYLCTFIVAPWYLEYHGKPSSSSAPTCEEVLNSDVEQLFKEPRNFDLLTLAPNNLSKESNLLVDKYIKDKSPKSCVRCGGKDYRYNCSHADNSNCRIVETCNKCGAYWYIKPLDYEPSIRNLVSGIRERLTDLETLIKKTKFPESKVTPLEVVVPKYRLSGVGNLLVGLIAGSSFSVVDIVSWWLGY